MACRQDCGWGGCGTVSAHVLLEWALVTECVVSSSRLFGEETVEAAGWAVARDGWVGTATVARVVVPLKVTTPATDPTVFVHRGVTGACVYVMG